MNKDMQKLLKEIPKGIIKWIKFDSGKRALYITGGPCDASLTEALRESGLNLSLMSATEIMENTGELEQEKSTASYDYIVIAGVFELVLEPESLLRKLRKLISDNGKLILSTENRLGIRYFCGDKDPFTHRNFDGIEKYRRCGISNNSHYLGQLYSKSEISELLNASGFNNHRFYSVFPDITAPQVLFAEDYTPVEELNIRVFPQYHDPSTVFLEEENLYTSLIENGMFHSMANGFLIECPVNSCINNYSYMNANQITISMDRGRENALCTLIRRDGFVEKKAVYMEGHKKLNDLLDNNKYLNNHGIKMAEAEIKENSYIMPYITGISLVTFFRKLARADREQFLNKLDDLWKLILQSSEYSIDTNSDLGPVLERGYIDLVILNGLMTNTGFIFFDQEKYIKNLPAKAIMLRNVDLLYHGDVSLEYVISRNKLLSRYKLSEKKDVLYNYEREYLNALRNDDILRKYHKEYRRNDEIVNSNRQRMNYSASEYQNIFVDIFKNIANKKLYIFGSGNFTKRFLALYEKDLDIEAILDNDETKWGEKINNIAIVNPQLLKKLDPSTYKVIICIKNYTSVLKQVKSLGAKNIGVYDTNIEYAFKDYSQIAVSKTNKEEACHKKYHVGYVAGVFDLFHIGHLNLLRRAKQMCDYLIVGVVTDEGVKKNKRTVPFIPFKERLELVASCKYVDEAVEIPLEFYDTKDAYLKYQFDVQFSGSDYSTDPIWLEKREFLREHGSELIFFPYTEGTSSTKLKKLINNQLL